MTVLKRVLRSDPAGVVIMKKYPSLKDAPGFELWKPAGAPVRGAGAGADDNDDAVDSEGNKPWQRERVFKDLANHKFTACSESEALASKQEWAALDRWHKAHPTPETTQIGQPISLTGSGTGSLELSCEPQVSWSEMWKTLMTLIPEDERQQPGDEECPRVERPPDTHAPQANATGAQTNAHKPTAGLASHAPPCAPPHLVWVGLRSQMPRALRKQIHG